MLSPRSTSISIALSASAISSANKSTIVEYVRDPAEADVHVLVTVSDTAMDSSSRAITESGDTEDTQRQRLATALTIGLLNYISSDGVRGGLTVDVEQAAPSGQAGPASDRWNYWVFSVQGTVSAQGEESTRELSFRGDVGADRITDDWKITTGFEIEYEREDFDVEDEEEIRATRNERDFDALVARSVNDHWSIGGRTSIDSSSFENISVRTFLAPAVEYNLFPYSQYTRRQLRIGYAIGPYYARYREETLYFTMSDAMAQQEGTVTLDQREQWGSLRAEIEYSSFIPDPSRYRVQLDGDVNVRLARGLSLTVQGQTSRLRDQLSIPRRGVTQEEVLLRLRRLRSGYEYNVEVGLTYTFGSIFNTIVNPRFGQ